MQLVKKPLNQKLGKLREREENTMFRINPGKAASFPELQTVSFKICFDQKSRFHLYFQI